MVKKLRFVVLLTLCQIPAVSTFLFAQCGVTPGLANEAGGIMEMNINAGPTTFDPDWVSYAWEWRVNNAVASVDSILQPLGITLPIGFSEVCLKVSATNTITGDSCTQEVCNVFHSTGRELFAELNVSAAGLTASASGYWFGSDPMSFPLLTIDWGDGSTSALASDMHTYAAPGDYLVCFSVLDNITFNSTTTCRKVQVDNGLTNMVVNNMSNVFSACYPFSVQSATTSPAHNGGFGYIHSYAAVPSSQAFANGALLQFPLSPQNPVVPGQAMIKNEIPDINPNPYPIERYAPVFFDVCGAVPDTIKGYVFNDIDADGIQDAGEPGIPNFQVNVRSAYLSYSNYGVFTDTAGFYSILAPNAIVVVHLFPLPAGSAITLPGSLSYTVDGVTNNNFPLYNFGIANLNTTISGKVYLDYNQDSIRNVPPDVNFNYVTMKAENTINGLTYYEHTNSSGAYTFDLTSGNYIITPTSHNLDSASFYPDTISISSTGGTFTNQHFGCYSPVAGNLRVRIFGFNEARPGFDYHNNIEILNTGFDTLSATIIFSFDPLLTAGSVTPVSGIIDNVNHTVTWQTGLLPAATQTYYSVNYTIPTATPLGTVLNFMVQGNVGATYTDNDLSNNSDTYSQIVIGSFDPNDKAVDPAGIGAQGDVLHGERLHYRIRFQNTGTASAIHVFVQDEIDQDLDLNTFLMERASHSYDVVTSGNTITWKFMNINLPDSNVNEPGSHGYIEYSIKAKQGLADGTEIENTAAIYFDFNAPVITNTTINTLQTSLVSIEEIADDDYLNLYPVPARNELTIATKAVSLGDVLIELTDLQGRSVKTIYKGNSTGELKLNVDLSGISSGVYIVRVSDSSRISRKMFVRQ
jgi:uncharacterized repeat protein (TIGR01451 family)